MGFEAALQQAGLPVHPERMSTAHFSMDSGFRQAEKLFALTPKLDCLFCATDAIALGAMQYCRSKGVRIPEDVMLASVGDSTAGQTVFVPLTSAHLHYHTAGQQAARLLMEQLNDPHDCALQPDAGLYPASPGPPPETTTRRRCTPLFPTRRPETL